MILNLLFENETHFRLLHGSYERKVCVFKQLWYKCIYIYIHKNERKYCNIKDYNENILYNVNDESIKPLFYVFYSFFLYIIFVRRKSSAYDWIGMQNVEVSSGYLSYNATYFVFPRYYINYYYFERNDIDTVEGK